MENDLLKMAAVLLGTKAPHSFAGMIARTVMDTGGRVRRGCATLEVPRSSYYLAATPTRSARGVRLMGDRIERIFKHHRRCYGYRRSVAYLADQGWFYPASRVCQIMCERGSKPSNPRLIRRRPVMA